MGPLSLPLELIEIILDQALPSPSYESPTKNPRIIFLLSLALVCRHLRAWAEQRLLDGPLTADGPADMDRLSRWLNARPGQTRRARDVALILQTGAEPSEAAHGRVSRQEKALKRLLSHILEVETLRVECRVQNGSLWGSDLFNGLQREYIRAGGLFGLSLTRRFADLHTLELIGVKSQHERPEPSRRSRLMSTFRSDQPPPQVVLCLRRLILCATTFPGIIIPHQLTHLSLLSHANITPWTETLPSLVGLRFLDLGGKPSVNARGMLLQSLSTPHRSRLALHRSQPSSPSHSPLLRALPALALASRPNLHRLRRDLQIDGKGSAPRQALTRGARDDLRRREGHRVVRLSRRGEAAIRRGGEESRG